MTSTQITHPSHYNVFHVYIGLDQKAGLYLGVAQLVGRVAWAHEVGGSNPPTQTIK